MRVNLCFTLCLISVDWLTERPVLVDAVCHCIEVVELELYMGYSEKLKMPASDDSILYAFLI